VANTAPQHARAIVEERADRPILRPWPRRVKIELAVGALIGAVFEYGKSGPRARQKSAIARCDESVDSGVRQPLVDAIRPKLVSIEPRETFRGA
jgi:hypothetical protein